MVKSSAHHANYRVFLDRVYRERDPARAVGKVTRGSRQRATARSRVTRQAIAAAQRVWTILLQSRARKAVSQ